MNTHTHTVAVNVTVHTHWSKTQRWSCPAAHPDLHQLFYKVEQQRVDFFQLQDGSWHHQGQVAQRWTTNLRRSGTVRGHRGWMCPPELINTFLIWSQWHDLVSSLDEPRSSDIDLPASSWPRSHIKVGQILTGFLWSHISIINCNGIKCIMMFKQH